ncbi:hypothetical protein SAMN04487897_1544 [Paenibacillus sp. yr247]|uniref:hypothetical protein n=1 Tax=Paenibacillus sp. yr247 TaxID=1761880 RepID=UPI0008925672|nr:hypothetical protein [Paenibacillus sp. yr247]SDP24123.1 hypothetical protein SAMN04487897_1544 [Paenibacillus sp. yr247]
MHKYIYWHAFFKVNTKEKALKLLTKFDDICETKATLLACERYWKDESLYEVSFATALNKEDISDAIFSTLVISHKLAYKWEVNGPSTPGLGVWEFHGLTTKTKVTGIDWIQFRIKSDE